MLHGCRKLVSWDVWLIPINAAQPFFAIESGFNISCSLSKYPGWFLQSALVKLRITSSRHGPFWVGLHTCYKGYNKKLQKNIRANLKTYFPKFRLTPETWHHEAGITSNRKLVMLRWICTGVLHTPPVTRWKLGMSWGCEQSKIYLRPKPYLVTGAKS